LGMTIDGFWGVDGLALITHLSDKTAVIVGHSVGDDLSSAVRQLCTSPGLSSRYVSPRLQTGRQALPRKKNLGCLTRRSGTHTLREPHGSRTGLGCKRVGGQSRQVWDCRGLAVGGSRREGTSK